MARVVTSEEESHHIIHPHHPYNPFLNPFKASPVIVREHIAESNHLFLTKPICGPLIFDNISSDARDHCANERTFLSWLRLSVYLAIVACAIIISFHLQEAPSDLERRMALPLGLVFWALALACLISGFATYVRTIVKYSRRAALVQSGWKTHAIFMVVAFVIFGACVLFLVTDKK